MSLLIKSREDSIFQSLLPALNWRENRKTIFTHVANDEGKNELIDLIHDKFNKLPPTIKINSYVKI